VLVVIAAAGLGVAFAPAPAAAERSAVRITLARPAGPPAAYTVARDTIRRQAREIVTLIAAGDTEAVYKRFTPEFAQALPEAELRRASGELLATAQVGARLADAALPLAPTKRLYLADHQWGDQTLGLAIQLDGVARIAALRVEPRRTLPPDERARYRTKTPLTLPFAGEWWTASAGRSELLSHHVLSRSERHAIDFAVWRDGGAHRGAGTRNSDYWVWNKPVVAPAVGRVVAAVDGIGDNRPGVMNPRRAAGNHVVLDFRNGECALLAHLRRGSVRVRPGQRVRAGAIVGLFGNSGNSSEPHLHVHLQNRPGLSEAAVGLPLAFVDVAIDNRLLARGTPLRGQFIRSVRRASPAAAADQRCSASSLPAGRPRLGLPAAVASMRLRIIAAARRCDYPALVRLGNERGRGLTFSYGASRSATEYWRTLERSPVRPRPTEALVKLLSMPHATVAADGYAVPPSRAHFYVWPTAHHANPTDRDWRALRALYTPSQIERMRRGRSYLGYRIGITPAGDWQFFVADE
jgi:murein DD-endopeptidase MepM/ murein hydrolase activator NlpD